MIEKDKILIWTTSHKYWFCQKHKLNNNLNKLLDKFKDIKFKNFDLSEKYWNKIVKRCKNSSELPKNFLKKLELESISHYDVIIFDLKCLLMSPFRDSKITLSSNSFVKNVLLNLIVKNRNKTFLILNVLQESNLNNIFQSNDDFNVLNLKIKRSSEIQSIDQININGEIVSFFYLNGQKIKKRLNNQGIKKYRSLWHATGNKNEITGFQVDNMYFLPFGCNAMPSILENINSLLNDSNKFDEEEIFDLLKTKDPNCSLKSLPIINDFWEKHLYKEKLNRNLSQTKKELVDCIPKIALLVKALEYQGKLLESIIENILKNFNFEILSQNKENEDRADIVFSFNYKRSKYTTIVEIKGYGKNKIERKPFDQVKLWSNKFIKENLNVKPDKTIKLVVLNNKLSDYDKRNVTLSETIKKHHDFPKDNSSNSNTANEGVKFITTLNLIKILYSGKENSTEILKKKLVSTETMEIELD